MLRGSNLSEDVGVRLDDRDLVYLEPALAATFERSSAVRGDLVFTNWGSVGQLGLIDEGSSYERYIVSNKQMKLSPDLEQIVPAFLYYYLSQPRMVQEVKSRAIGSTIPGFNLGQLRALPIEIPALKQQRAIAEVLGAFDDKIAANFRLADVASELAKHIYDETASNVRVATMRDVLEPILGGTPSRANPDFWGGSELWASAKDVTGAPFSVILDTAEKITNRAIERTKAKPLPAGSVILTARGTVGAVARLAAPSSFNQSCYGFVPGVLPPGVLYFSVLRATQQAKAMAHGSVFDTITMQTFDHLELPDFGDEVIGIESKVGPLLDQVAQCVAENSALTKTRDTLLPQLMSGKLQVKDAERLVEATV